MAHSFTVRNLMARTDGKPHEVTFIGDADFANADIEVHVGDRPPVVIPGWAMMEFAARVVTDRRIARLETEGDWRKILDCPQ